jgi:hypothetical protein
MSEGEGGEGGEEDGLPALSSTNQEHMPITNAVTFNHALCLPITPLPYYPITLLPYYPIILLPYSPIILLSYYPIILLPYVPQKVT